MAPVSSRSDLQPGQTRRVSQATMTCCPPLPPSLTFLPGQKAKCPAASLRRGRYQSGRSRRDMSTRVTRFAFFFESLSFRPRSDATGQSEYENAFFDFKFKF